ncbi:MAG: hypothetical protein IT495_11855 [Gammaproteobacteria bacterium]|nr:hypothetical protein [Gammaproteobacteria bacterium]
MNEATARIKIDNLIEAVVQPVDGFGQSVVTRIADPSCRGRRTDFSQSRIVAERVPASSAAMVSPEEACG